MESYSTTCRTEQRVASSPRRLSLTSRGLRGTDGTHAERRDAPCRDDRDHRDDLGHRLRCVRLPLRPMEGISRRAYPRGRGALFPQRLLTLLVGDRPFLHRHSRLSRRICCELTRATGGGVGWFPYLDRCFPLADHLGILDREARVAVVEAREPHRFVV